MTFSPRPTPRSESLVDGLQRPEAERAHRLRLPAEPHRARGWLAHPAGAGTAGNRHRRDLPPEPDHERELYPQRDVRGSGDSVKHLVRRDTQSVLRQLDYGFGLAWELDFWGRFRRAVIAATDNLDASIADYDQVVVTLLADVASNYVTVRTTQERINLLQGNVDLQKGVLDFVDNRLQAGFKQTELDVDQALSTLRQTQAGIEQLQITLREAKNALCVLLGMPASDLTNMLGTGPIPSAPPEVVIGIPVDLIRRRPDVRRSERLAAAQSEQIGIANRTCIPLSQSMATSVTLLASSPTCSKPPRSTGPLGRRFNGTCSITDESQTISACKMPSSRNSLSRISRPCSRPTRRRKTPS